MGRCFGARSMDRRRAHIYFGIKKKGTINKNSFRVQQSKLGIGLPGMELPTITYQG